MNQCQLSPDADALIDNLFKDIDIYIFKEFLDHDGQDSDGYKSNLWDLYIIDSDFNVYNYHWEDWFCHSKQEQNQYSFTKYSLYKKSKISDISYYTYDILIKHVKKFDDKNLIKEFEEYFKNFNLKA
jgi:hypothetical protein